ncbi:MAG: DUF1152 domain-containing protein [Patescibacteria group bacterium]|nr:DUF1152 domain-containing protein [Patescibacteria group bacterium]
MIVEKGEFNRVLFVGIGGGNDIFSCVLAAASLKRLGWEWNECAFAGVVSPFHRITMRSTPMPGVSIITPESERFLIRHDMPRKIPFISASVSQMVKDEDVYGAVQTYGLSLKRGSVGLAESFRALAKVWDRIVLVDIGGDVFYRGPEDMHVLSPMFDSMVLRGFVDSGAPGLLFEAGPGTDGELEPDAFMEAVSSTDHTIRLLHADDVDAVEALYKQWIEPVRPGRTVSMTIKAFRSSERELVERYRARAKLGVERWYEYFNQHLDADLNRRFYLVDPATIRNPFAVRCANPLEWFIRTQVRQHATNCEAHLQYFRHNGVLYQFLTPSPFFPEEKRKEMIDTALGQQLSCRMCDCQLMFPDDWDALQMVTGPLFCVSRQDGLVAISPK